MRAARWSGKSCATPQPRHRLVPRAPSFFLRARPRLSLRTPRPPAPRRAQVDVVERRARHALGKATARLHLVEGFLKALDKLDAIVKVGGRRGGGRASKRPRLMRNDRKARLSVGEGVWGGHCVPTRFVEPTPNPQVIRSAADGPAARAALMSKPFNLSEAQAEGVLGLTLRRLTGLEVGKLREEEGQLKATIAGLQVGAARKGRGRPGMTPGGAASGRLPKDGAAGWPRLHREKTAGCRLPSHCVAPVPAHTRTHHAPAPAPGLPRRCWATARRCWPRWCGRPRSWRQSTGGRARRASWCAPPRWGPQGRAGGRDGQGASTGPCTRRQLVRRPVAQKRNSCAPAGGGADRGGGRRRRRRRRGSGAAGGGPRPEPALPADAEQPWLREAPRARHV
jgi:hypothetical protein